MHTKRPTPSLATLSSDTLRRVTGGGIEGGTPESEVVLSRIGAEVTSPRDPATGLPTGKRL